MNKDFCQHVIPRCVRIRLGGRREWWWGITANWKDAEKHWRSELKEQSLECNRCQGTGDLVSGKLSRVLKRHTAEAASSLQPLRTAAPFAEVKYDSFEHCVCLEDFTSQSPVNTEKYSTLKSQLQVRKKPMQYNPP